MQWNLIRTRKEAGLTQPEMSKLINVEISTYRNKETGKTQFNANEMFIISNYFNKPIEEIFLPLDSILNGVRKTKVH